jgi:hypothetical protein
MHPININSDFGTRFGKSVETGVMDMVLRDEIEQLYQGDSEFRQDFKLIIPDNVPLFINSCLWINEPRATSYPDLPYLLRPFQAEFINILVDHFPHSGEIGRELLCDKTREMGVTWMVMTTLFHHWLFKRGFSALVGSITEKKIDDKGAQDTIFAKFDYHITRLTELVEEEPRVFSDLIPKTYVEKRDKNHLKRVNTANNSIVKGEPMGENFGRSGRYAVLFLDEWAEAPMPEATMAACSRSSDCKIFVFTPKGMNYAGKMANPAPDEPRSITKVSLHWKIDPSKNRYIITLKDGTKVSGNGEVPAEFYNKYPDASKPVYPWYNNAKASLKFDEAQIGQELDINYKTSVAGKMYRQIAMSGKMAFAYDPKLPLYATIDFGLADPTSIAWIQWNFEEKRYKVIDCFTQKGKTIKWYVPFLTGDLGDTKIGESESEYQEHELEVIKRHEGFKNRYVEIYGDPAGRQRAGATATSVIDSLAEYGIEVTALESYKSMLNRKNRMGQGLLFTDFNTKFCYALINAIEESKQNEKGVPIHDMYSHYRTAMEYFYVGNENLYDGVSVEEQRRQALEALEKDTEETRYLLERKEAEKDLERVLRGTINRYSETPENLRRLERIQQYLGYNTSLVTADGEAYYGY